MRVFRKLSIQLLPIIALIGALIIGAIILALQDIDIYEAYSSMIVGAFGSKNGMADTLVKAIPLLFVALGIVIAYRGGVINIGAEGQLIMGALVTTYFGVEYGESLNPWIMIPILILLGTAAGFVWGAIPGILKARLSVNEILTTIMLNQVAIQIAFFLLRGPMLDPDQVAQGTNVPQSARLPRVADLPRMQVLSEVLGFNQSTKDLEMAEGWWTEFVGLFLDSSRLHTGIIIALFMSIVVYIFMWRTTIGYRIRAVGQNPAAARYAGINVQRYTVLALALSGALAGMAGAVEIVGLHHRMFEPTAVSAGYGFSGIVAALFGKLHPFGAIPASLLFGGLLVGGDKMQRAVQVPNVMITALLGLIVLFVVSSDLWARNRIEKLEKEEAVA
ncbi:MAG: ABC transporter permease [Chloroflexota bacterium]